MSVVTTEDTVKVSGHTIRRLRSHGQMLASGLAIVQGGNWRPTVREIATGAGYTMRLFHHHWPVVQIFWVELIDRYPKALGRALGIADSTDDALRHLLFIVLMGRKEIVDG